MPAVKRTAAAGGASKRIKLSGPFAQKFHVLEKAIQASDLPESVRKMIIESLPFTLGKPQDERHPFQTEVIRIIGKMLEGITEGMEGEISKLQEQLEAAEKTKTQKQDETAAVMKKLEEKEEVVKKRTHELAAVAKAFRAAKSAHLAAKTTQAAEDAGLEKAAKKKQQLEAAVKDLITPLTEPPEEGSNTAEMKTAFTKFLSTEGFQESLVTALMSALDKAPAERGQFDQLCFKELNDEVSKRVADLDAQLSAGDAGMKDRAAAVQTAKEAYDAAVEKQIAAAALFTSAEKEQEEATEEVNATEKAKKDSDNEMRKKNQSLGRAKKKLEDFQTGPVATFKELEEGAEFKGEDPTEAKTDEAMTEAKTVDEVKDA
mmetsp:Transcript_141803/g.246928  ORF Transcript_141803/g.246928 Transcript_141803/m.246928 type:complete len:374 (-) Transcript_141803:103-1224(-)